MQQHRRSCTSSLNNSHSPKIQNVQQSYECLTTMRSTTSDGSRCFSRCYRWWSAPSTVASACTARSVRRSGSSGTLVRLPQVISVEHDLTKHTHEWQRARCFTWLHQKLTACSVFFPPFLRFFIQPQPPPESATSSSP